eukprot:4101574-Amphidinium_carterae.1
MEDLQRVLAAQQQLQQQQHEEMMALRQIVTHLSQQPAAGARQSAEEGTRLRFVIDPKVLSNIPAFSGLDEEFVEWEVRFRALCGLLGLDEKLRMVEEEQTEDK